MLPRARTIPAVNTRESIGTLVMHIKQDGKTEKVEHGSHQGRAYLLGGGEGERKQEKNMAGIKDRNSSNTYRAPMRISI